MDNHIEGVFITQFNLKRIIPDNLPDYARHDIAALVCYSKIKNIFNDNELNQFLKLWVVLEDPSILVKYYSEISDKDKPEAYSSYHHDSDCPELHKWYLDYSINNRSHKKREEISAKVRHAFRDYSYKNNYSTEGIRFDFKENTVATIREEKILGTIPANLKNELDTISIKYPGEIGHLFDLYPNSGIHAYKNYSIAEIENEINRLIAESEAFRSSNPFLEKKIANITYAEIKKIKEMQDEEKQKWAIEFKEPLSRAITNYYWIKFNPELTVNKTILDSIGFKPCRRCIKT